MTPIAFLLAFQINSGPTPEQLGKALQVHRYMIEFGMGEPESVPFPIARYLAIASHVQSLPERERVTWLRMAAASPHLQEASIYIGRMLITSKDKPLRAIRALIGDHAAGKPSKEFTDSPIEIYDGVPFLVARDDNVGMSGMVEPACDYIEYLLANGEWRDLDFARKTNSELSDTASRYVEHLETSGFAPTAEFVKSINAQARVPLKSSRKTP